MLEICRVLAFRSLNLATYTLGVAGMQYAFLHLFLLVVAYPHEHIDENLALFIKSFRQKAQDSAISEEGKVGASSFSPGMQVSMKIIPHLRVKFDKINFTCFNCHAAGLKLCACYDAISFSTKYVHS